jgi:hypothetical protein
MTPRWLTEMLIDQGRLSESGLTRRTRLRTHRPCSVLTVAGFDSDRAALDAWCDPHPLTNAGEVEALLDDRWTYELVGQRLERRDRWNIPGHPPSHELVVLASHVCDSPIPAGWRLPPAPPAPRRVEGTF